MSIAWSSISLFSLLFSVLPSHSVAVSPATDCYTGNGTISGDFPCDTSQDVSFCCGIGWSCISNGLCQYRDSTSFAEGSCTDKTFPTDSCLAICVASGNEGQTLVHNCGGAGDGDKDSWCCAGVEGTTGQGQDCCSTNATTTLGPYPYSTITVISSVSRSSSHIASSVQTSSFSSLFPTGISSSSSGPSSSSLSPSSTSSAPSFSTSTSPSTTPTPTSQSTGNHSVALGAGIGIPFGLLLLAILGMLIYRDRRARKSMADLLNRISDARGPTSGQTVSELKGFDDQRHELPTGFDRGELPNGYEHHELANEPRQEML